jgi:hypothetical protein
MSFNLGQSLLKKTFCVLVIFRHEKWDIQMRKGVHQSGMTLTLVINGKGLVYTPTFFYVTQKVKNKIKIGWFCSCCINANKEQLNTFMQ